MKRRATMPVATAALMLGLALSGCGGSSKPKLVVSAAASLKTAFTAYAAQFTQADVRLSFAGSDALAAQIEQGVKPDVFASANKRLPEMLYAKGLVEKPEVFTSNRLVLAVPGSSSITGLVGAEKPGVVLAIGTTSVPVGEYTRKVLGKLPAGERATLSKNVKDEESDVTGIIGKLTEGAVQAGFLYATDVTGTKGKLKSIELPASLQPKVAYAAAIVKGGSHHAQAQAFIDGLLQGAGSQDLVQAGFRSP
jgi:molybdate transport system substrate-binding protein